MNESNKTQKFDLFTMNDTLISFMLFIFVYIIRFPILVPKGESDEVSFCIIGRSLASGMAIYREIAHFKGPFRYYAFALFSKISGGLTPVSLRISLVFVMALSALLLYFAVKNFFNDQRLAFFVGFFWAVSDYLLSHNTILSYTYATAGIFFFSLWYRKEKLMFLFVMGLFFGIALMTNQRSFPFMAVAGLYLLLRYGLFKKEFYLQGFTIMGGFLLPVILILVHLFMISAFEDYIFQTFYKALAYSETKGFWASVRMPFGKLYSLIRYQLGFLVFFLVYRIVEIIKRKEYKDPRYLFLLLWLGVCFVATFIDGKFVKRYNLYFLIPAVIFTFQGLLMLFDRYAKKIKKRLQHLYRPVFVLFAAICLIQTGFVFQHEISRRFETYKSYMSEESLRKKLKTVFTRYVDKDKDFIYVFDTYMGADIFLQYRPGVRFIYSKEQLFDTKAFDSPKYRLEDTWAGFYEDMESNKPVLVVDTTGSTFHRDIDFAYPEVNRYRDRLLDYVMTHYTEVERINRMVFYRRKAEN